MYLVCGQDGKSIVIVDVVKMFDVLRKYLKLAYMYTNSAVTLVFQAI